MANKKQKRINLIGKAIDSIDEMVGNYEKQIALLDELIAGMRAKRLECSKSKVLYKRLAFAVARDDKASVREIRHQLNDIKIINLKW